MFCTSYKITNLLFSVVNFSAIKSGIFSTFNVMYNNFAILALKFF